MSIASSLRSDRAYDLARQSGTILGTLFRHHHSDEYVPVIETSFSETESRSIEQRRARHLLDNYWGSYILVQIERLNRRVEIFRGPMSQLPCYHARLRDVHLFFSDVEDCVHLSELRFTVDWDCIRAQAAFGGYQSRLTAISQIDSIEPGESCVISDAGAARTVYWSPGAIARDCSIARFECAAELLRSTTRAAVRGWASSHERVIHLLSGGLDSSIVLGCLQRPFPTADVSCIHYYTDGNQGNERVYAGATASHFGVEMLEIRRDRNVDVTIFTRCARTAYPVLNLSAHEVLIPTLDAARSVDATCIFDGELGDELFGCSVGTEALTECISRYGLTSRFFRYARDFAAMRRLSLWRVVFLALRGGMAAKPAMSALTPIVAKADFDPASHSLVSLEALSQFESDSQRYLHPWLHDVEDVPRSKGSLIAALVGVLSPSYRSPFKGLTNIPAVSPLVSQPVIELSLKMESCLSFLGARNRALARAAFADDLPTLISGRIGKGGDDDHAYSLIMRYRKFIEEFLLDGLLVKHRILSAEKIKSAMSGHPGSRIMPNDVIAKLYIEGWARQWCRH